jgi:carboxylesterase
VPVPAPRIGSPATRPLLFPGGTAGILLVHGITATPYTVRELGERLAKAGFTVLAPLMAGHGTRWQDLERTRWQDWYASVEKGYLDLARRCRKVVAMGISMGGTQVLHLAAHHPGLAGVVAMAPALYMTDWRAPFLPLIRRLVRAVPGVSGLISDPAASEPAYPLTPTRSVAELVAFQRHLRDELQLIRCPALFAHGALDPLVVPGNSRFALSRISSRRKSLLVLARSSHVVTLDLDRELLFRETAEFSRSVTR